MSMQLKSFVHQSFGYLKGKITEKRCQQFSRSEMNDFFWGGTGSFIYKAKVSRRWLLIIDKLLDKS